MLRRIATGAALALLAIAAITAIWLYQEIVTLDTERVSEDVYALFGQGGNVGVLRTETGAIVVDTMRFPLQGRRVRRLVEQLVEVSVETIVNTHYHADHSHGNPGFPAHTPIVATERTRELLLERDADAWSGAFADFLPNRTFPDRYELASGGKTVQLFHFGPAHTGGDLVVLFVEDRVLHAGDLLFTRYYPLVDLDAGGSLPGWVDALNRTLELDFDTVIPGHGEITDRAGLEQFRDFLAELWEQAQRAVREGWSLEEAQQRIELTQARDYRVFQVPLPALHRVGRDDAIAIAWREAQQSKRRP